MSDIKTRISFDEFIEGKKVNEFNFEKYKLRCSQFQTTVEGNIKEINWNDKYMLLLYFASNTIKNNRKVRENDAI